MTTQEAPAVPTPIAPVSRGPITLEMLKLYAEASGDYNPIHVDETAAKSVGLPGIIAHGMLSAGLLASRAAEVVKPLSGKWEISKFQSRFKAMIYLGDVITIAGTLTKHEDTGTIRLELSATNAKGELATQAVIEFKSAELT